MSQLVTGEAVALDLRTAALPSRLLAGVLDGLLQVPLLLVLVALAARLAGDAEAAQAALGLLALVAVLVGFPVTFETVLRGRTPGKAALGLRVVRDDGGPIGFRHALVRGLAGAFLERFGVTFFAGAVLTMLLNDRNKRIGDLLAGTVVLRERVPGGTAPVAVMPPPLASWATGLDLSRLPDDVALAARSFVGRSAELTPAAREELGSRLVGAVRATTTPPPPDGTPGWAYLAAVLAERRRREEVRLAGSAPQQRPQGQPPYAPPPQAPPQPQYAPQPAQRQPPPPPRPGGFSRPG